MDKAAETSRCFEILISCPGCGGCSISLGYPPDLWHCDCGLYFRNPRLNFQTIRHHYDQGLTYCRFQREQSTREMLWKKRLRLVLNFRTSGHLLDLGTGDGHFLRVCSRHFTAEGTEVSQEGVRLAREHGTKVHHGTLAELPLEAGAYGVVTLWHVLEHLPDPAEELVRIRRLLEPGGYLFVAVPNEARTLDRQRLLRRRVSPYPPPNPHDEIHLTYFTPSVLSEFLRRHGFVLLGLVADDVDTERTVLSRGGELLWRLAGATVGRRWSRAMVAACRLEPK